MAPPAGITNTGGQQTHRPASQGITHRMEALELGNLRGEQEMYFSLPVLGLFHYPLTWMLPLTVTSGILLISRLE